MKLVLILLMSALVGPVAMAQSPQKMIRFWRGYAQDRSNVEGLRTKLNDGFLKETVLVGAGRGLQAYMPVMYDNRNMPMIPDESAVLVYESKAAYDAIRATPRGARYGKSHFDPGMFVSKTDDGFESKSTEAVAYNSAVSIVLDKPSAYVMSSEGNDWQVGIFLHRIVKMNSPMTASFAKSHLETLNELQTKGAIKAAVVLVDANYIMELVQFRSLEDINRMMGALARVDGSAAHPRFPTILRPTSVDNVNLYYREGLSLQFDPSKTLTDKME